MNPIGFISTSVAVKPQALDPLDFNKNERVLINRIDPYETYQTNKNN